MFKKRVKMRLNVMRGILTAKISFNCFTEASREYNSGQNLKCTERRYQILHERRGYITYKIFYFLFLSIFSYHIINLIIFIYIFSLSRY